MYAGLRRRLHDVLEGSTESRVGRVFDMAMMTLILANVAAVVVETVPSIEARFGPELYWFEVLSVVVFTVEYAARLWVCIESAPVRRHGKVLGRVRFAMGPYLLIDLMAILPFYVSLIVPIADLRILRIFRLLRVFKLARYSPALAGIARVIVQERRALFAALVIMLGLLVVASTAIYYAERHVQPDAFGSIPQAMWWGLATLTTVGFGDVVPATDIGRFIGGVVMIFGVGMAALPVAIIASAFAQEIHRRDFVISFSMVANVPLFSHLDVATVSKITRVLQAISVDAGTAIIRKGEAPESMYFLASGEVEVMVKPEPVTLRTGDHFGEIALVKGTERTATVRAVTACRLLVLERDALEDLMRTDADFRAELTKIADARIAEFKR